VIARAGKPVVRLVPVLAERGRLSAELGGLARGRDQAEVRKIVDRLETPFSDEEVSDFLRNVEADDHGPGK
jgi:antitoxin (DNA-binding transcriptional repressor) of toxin-antitoxin stability system